jgi:hypothetical protein
MKWPIEPPTVPTGELALWIVAVTALALAVWCTGGLCRQ